MPPDGFAAQLIAALEAAQATQAQSKPAHQLAQAAYEKLQFDFPVVSEAELAALVDEFASGKRHGVTARFLAVLQENAGGSIGGSIAAAGAATSATSSSSGGQGLVPLYQQLYAAAVLQTLQFCLEAPGAAAAAELAGLAPAAAGSGTLFGAEGASQLEAALAAATLQGVAGGTTELEHRLSQQEDDDSLAYEPLEAAPPTALPLQALQPATAQPGGSGAAAPLPTQLAALAAHLSYHCMGEATVWRELRLMQRLATCLAALRRHPRLPDLAAVAQPLLQLAVDRCVAAPAELEAGLPALLDALGATAGGSSSSSSKSGGRAPASQQGSGAASDATAAELAVEVAVALAAQVTAASAQRRLWQETCQRLLPLAAQQLEQQQVQLTRQARAARLAGGAAGGVSGTAGGAQPSAQQLYTIWLACQLLYFFVLQAPPCFTTAAAAAPGGGSSSSGSRLQEALLAGGLLRSLVLLFMQLGAQPGAEPLRSALLLACAGGQPLADWAAAVPGFTAAVAAPGLRPGGAAQLHGALWRVLLGGGGGALAALLGDATPADKVPAIFQALQLMADVQAVARRPLWDAEVAAALRALGDTLRQQYGKPRDEPSASESSSASGSAGVGGQAAAGVAEQGAAEGLDDRADAAKLAVGAQEQAARMAARRAQQLQPPCLKLVKDLQQRGGGSGKHD